MYTMILLFLTTNGSREEFIKRNKNILDMSNYPELCKKIGVDANENKMKPGWLKLEPASDKSPDESRVIEFYARAPKMYYILSETNKQKIRTKGFQDGLITCDELLHCQNIEKSTYNIRSDLHEVKTKLIKRSINNENNNKRIFTKTFGETLPIGYKGKEILVQS
jgi:hypothetical protein